MLPEQFEEANDPGAMETGIEEGKQALDESRFEDHAVGLHQCHHFHRHERLLREMRPQEYVENQRRCVGIAARKRKRKAGGNNVKDLPPQMPGSGEIEPMQERREAEDGVAAPERLGGEGGDHLEPIGDASVED
jgi:hypothetical protein